MVLTACPECGASISDRALACPQCGLPEPSAVRRQEGAVRAAIGARQAALRRGWIEALLLWAPLWLVPLAFSPMSDEESVRSTMAVIAFLVPIWWWRRTAAIRRWRRKTASSGG